MTTPYTGAQPNDDFGLRFASFKFDTTLATATEQTLEVPGRSPRYKAVFSIPEGEVVWVALNATATSAGAAFAPTDSELNPRCREVNAGDVLHFITPGTGTEIGVAFYTLSSLS